MYGVELIKSFEGEDWEAPIKRGKVLRWSEGVSEE